MKTKEKLQIKGVHEVSWIRNGEIIKTEIVHNIVTKVGLNVIFKKMANEYAEDLHIDKAGLGTGTTAPSFNDVELETEVYRNNTISQTAEDNVLYVDAYFSSTEVDGTFKEFGYFIDNDVLFNRVAVDWTKGSLDALFIRSSFTITNS